MDHRIRRVPTHTLLPNTQLKRIETSKDKRSFQSILDQKHSELKISKHAQTRLNERKINISKEKWSAIEAQVQIARKKGITDSLVITDEATLVISTKSNTVVTALDREEAKSRIFTNINGTILLD